MSGVLRPHARIIGMHEGNTPKQVEVVSRILLDNFASISWDGDMVRKGCFTEALVPFIERQHAAGKLNTTVLPRCMPDSDGTATQNGDLARGMVPRAIPITREDYERSLAFLDENLAPDWRDGYTGDMEGYMALAASHRLIARPDAVIWVLDDDRPRSRYHAWACLGEYRSFAGVDDDKVKLILVSKDGHLLSPAEIARMPWFPQSIRTSPRPGYNDPVG